MSLTFFKNLSKFVLTYFPVMEIIRTPDTSNECALVNVLYRLIEHCDKEAGLDTFPKFKELINTTYDRPGRRTVPQTLNEYRNSEK